MFYPRTEKGCGGEKGREWGIGLRGERRQLNTCEKKNFPGGKGEKNGPLQTARNPSGRSRGCPVSGRG